MGIFSHRHENLFSWAREFRLFVTPHGRTGEGGLRLHGQSRHPVPPRTNVLLVVQEVFLMCTEREFHSDGFVFSRLTIAACALPAGSKVHEPDSCLPTAISRLNLEIAVERLESGMRPLFSRGKWICRFHQVGEKRSRSCYTL